MPGILIVVWSVAALAASPEDASWDRIRYIGGVVSTRVRIDESENSATLSADRLTLRLSDGQVLEIPTVAVTFLGYTREAIPDDTLIGVPTLVAPVPVFYMGWLRKAGLHYVAIDYTRTDGGTARVLLQPDKKNYVQMLTALSASTGIRVSMPKRSETLPEGIRRAGVESAASARAWHRSVACRAAHRSSKGCDEHRVQCRRPPAGVWLG